MNKFKGSWTVKNSKPIYKNPWIEVIEDQVVDKKGKERIFGVVKMKPGVTILPIDGQGNVYLTQEYHYAVERESIEAISGGIEKGENPLDAAKRELKEETGISAKEWMNLGVVDPFTTVIASPNHIFLAKNLSFNLPSENIKILKVSFKKAFEWAMESKITHSATCTLILKVAHFYEKIPS